MAACPSRSAPRSWKSSRTHGHLSPLDRFDELATCCCSSTPADEASARGERPVGLTEHKAIPAASFGFVRVDGVSRGRSDPSRRHRRRLRGGAALLVERDRLGLGGEAARALLFVLAPADTPPLLARIKINA